MGIPAPDDKNTDKTVRFYRNRLQDFLHWSEENGIETMRDLDGWWLGEYERFLESGEDAPPRFAGS